eukprot:14864_1
MNVKPNLAKCRKAGTKFKLLSTSEGRDGLFKSISDNLHISDDHINALIDWKLSYLKAMHEEQKFLDYDTQFPFQSMPQIKKLSDNDTQFPWPQIKKLAEILMIYDQYGHCIYNWSEESGEAIHPKIKDAFYKYYKLADTLTTSQFCNKIKNDVELQFHCYATATLTKKDRQKSNTNKLTREQKQQQNMEKSNPYNCTVRVDIDSIRIFWCAYCNSEKVSVKNERCKYCRNNRTFEILTNLVNTLKEKGYPNGITDDWKIMFNEVGLEYKQLENELKALKNRSKLEEQYKKT